MIAYGFKVFLLLVPMMSVFVARLFTIGKPWGSKSFFSNRRSVFWILTLLSFIFFIKTKGSFVVAFSRSTVFLLFLEIMYLLAKTAFWSSKEFAKGARAILVAIFVVIFGILVQLNSTQNESNSQLLIFTFLSVCILSSFLLTCLGEISDRYRHGMRSEYNIPILIVSIVFFFTWMAYLSLLSAHSEESLPANRIHITTPEEELERFKDEVDSLSFKKYSICSSDWNGMNVLDFALISRFSYLNSTEFSEKFGDYFSKEWNFQNPDRSYQTSVRFFEFVNANKVYILRPFLTTKDISIIGIRGTSTGSDGLQDFDLWFEALTVQVSSLIY